jgi:hypothetical protein
MGEESLDGDDGDERIGDGVEGVVDARWRDRARRRRRRWLSMGG